MSKIIGIEIHDILGLSQPLTKLFEIVKMWYEHSYKMKKADAGAYEIQVISEAIANNIHFPVKYSDGNVTINLQDSELAKRAGNRFFKQELKRQQNIERIVDLARIELEKEKYVTDEPVDPDWTMRFFNSVEDISNEDMQKIWGKILAGEVKRPQSFSMRTLETLKNLSQKEALLFQKLANFCFFGGNDILLSGQNELLANYGLRVIDILTIEECGLIQSSAGRMGLIITSERSQNVTIHTQNIVGILSTKNGVNMQVDLPVHRLTGSGSELFKIIEKSPNDEYFLSYLKYIRSTEKSINVSAHKITSLSKDGATYSTPDILPPEDEIRPNPPPNTKMNKRKRIKHNSRKTVQ